MSAILGDIIKLLEARYPSAWAMSGDKIGLEVGHPEKPVKALLVALEVSPALITEAASRGAQLLLTHHPLLYQPVTDVREDHPAGKLLADLLRSGLAMLSCHTNLDIAPGGLNDYLAEKLELQDLDVLTPTTRDPWYKLVVFVPAGYEDPVRQALGDAGLGVIGPYSHCAFASKGQGAYRPLAGAQPFQGKIGEFSRVEETRLEMLAPESLLPQALSSLKAVHPYETVAYDLYPVQHHGTPLGLGRIGSWLKPRPFTQVLEALKTIFAVATVQVWGEPPAKVQRLALCSGSGGELLADAMHRGAEVYLTGEIRHHQVPPGLAEDFAVLAVGHFASEVVFMEPWAGQLRQLFSEAGLGVEVMVAASQSPVCRTM
jgi:dinuclear metal center YbgI/SA1388 family protein